MTKNIIAIVVYNRPDNIKHWLHCWEQCNKTATLVIIHNDNGDTYNLPDDVIYIKRENIGFDIGAFQDVCLNRLPGFPEWDNLLWLTDDVFPMSKDFATSFWEALKTVDVACMSISPFVRRHIRTTGFAITQKVADLLRWDADPITTKEDCYQFEHRSKATTFLEQVENAGLKAIQVAPNESSPLFDTEYTRRVKTRLQEHYDLFGKHEPLVVFICPAYNDYPYIIHSLQQQTHKNWKLYLIHDGPNNTGLKKQVELINDSRVNYFETKARSENWGHSIRSEWLQKVTGDYVVITNQDNYHMPVFIEYMLRGFTGNAIATYCSDMVHSYKAWQIIPCSMRRGYVDCAGVMMRLSSAKEVGWHDVTSHSADWFFFEAVIKQFGINSFIKVKGCLLSHN